MKRTKEKSQSCHLEKKRASGKNKSKKRERERERNTSLIKGLLDDALDTRSLKALLHLLSSQDHAALVSGGTSKGVSKYYDGTLIGSPPVAPTILVSTLDVRLPL